MGKPARISPEQKKAKPRYSGPLSKPFWDRVHATGDMGIYQMGCILQDVEERVLYALSEEEQSSRPSRQGRR
jgi:hypothetical protein